jgi:nuclear pore complex protein Nup50
MLCLDQCSLHTSAISHLSFSQVDAHVDSSKPLQFGPNNGIFGDKKDTPRDSSKPFHFGANKGIFGDKKTTSGDNSNPFQFGANNGFPTSNAPSIFLQLPKVLTHRVHLCFQ